MKPRTLIPLLAAAALAVGAPVAAADSPTSRAYSDSGGNSQADVGSGGPAGAQAGTPSSTGAPGSGPAAAQAQGANSPSHWRSSPPESTGSLPFTGLDLGLVVGAGVLLLLLGLWLRRTALPHDAA